MDLTVPQDGSTASYDLLSRYLKDQLRLLTKSCGSARIRPLLKDHAGAVFSVLRRPTVGGPLRCGLASAALAQLHFELAADGIAVDSGPIDNPPATLIALGARRTLTLDPEIERIEFAGGRLIAHSLAGTTEIDIAAGDGVPAHHAIRDGLTLSLVDNNPQSDLEAHPEKSGNAVDLGERPISEWLGALREALGLVERFLPRIDREIRLVAHQIIPVGYHSERHMSASYLEVIGNIYMTLHPDVLTLAEAIVHEFSHNKLNMLFSLDAVLENAFSPLFPSPVRPDPRPLHGVLLAVHAFLPVERMYERMAAEQHPLAVQPRFLERQAKVRANNEEAAGVVIAHGRPTPAGRILLDEIAEWNAYFAALNTPG